MTRFWSNRHQVKNVDKVKRLEKPNNLKVSVGKETKIPKQDSNNQLWSPISEGEEQSAEVTYI